MLGYPCENIANPTNARLVCVSSRIGLEGKERKGKVHPLLQKPINVLHIDLYPKSSRTATGARNSRAKLGMTNMGCLVASSFPPSQLPFPLPPVGYDEYGLPFT